MGYDNKRTIFLLLSTSLSILAAGCFSGYFIIYVWVNTVRLTSATYANDAYVAVTLAAYFTMCALFGAAIGLMLHSLATKTKSRRKADS